jgi:hypothetical protein
MISALGPISFPLDLVLVSSCSCSGHCFDGTVAQQFHGLSGNIMMADFPSAPWGPDESHAQPGFLGLILETTFPDIIILG